MILNSDAVARSLLNERSTHSERLLVFSVTPEPIVSKPAYDPQARPARGDQPSSDGFAALVDSNAPASRPARPAPDAPRRDTRGSDAPAQSNRPQSDTAASAPQNGSGNAQQKTESSKTTQTSSADGKPQDKTKSASADDKSEKTAQDSDATAASVTPVIAPALTDPVAVVIAAVADPATAPTDETASTAVAAASAIANGSATTAPGETTSVQTSADADTAVANTAAMTGASAPTADAAATDATAAATSAAATVIKTDSGKTEIAAKDGEAAAPTKNAKTGKQASDAAAKLVTDRAIKPDAHTEHNGDTSQSQDKIASEAGSPDTESSKHAGKTAQQAEHRAAAPSPQQLAPTDPAPMQPVTGVQPQPIQMHTANLTAVPVPTSNSALADASVPLNGLAADIAVRAAAGNSRFEIRLDPAELGRIDVRLDVDKHGNVTSHLTVERPATLDMLRNDAPRLQQALEDAGLKTGDSGLQFSLRDQSSSGRDGDNGAGRNSQRVVIAEEDTVPTQVAGRTYGRMLGSSGGVDIRI